MSLNSLAAFSGRRPLTVIAAWIIIMITAGILSFFLLESALGGNGQGPTKDLEFKLAKDLKDITLKDVVVILESDIFTPISQPNNKGLELFWDDLKTNVSKVFEIPLSELKNYQLKATDTLNYSI